MERKIYIVANSGGRDSAAVSVWIANNPPKDAKSIHFITADIGEEPSDFHPYLGRLFKNILMKRGYKLEVVESPHEEGQSPWDAIFMRPGKEALPGPMFRSCTDHGKARPMQAWRKKNFADKPVTWVVGFRADEGNQTRRLSADDIMDGGDKAWKPFLEMGWGLDKVHEILKESGLGIPSFYKWTQRSGCAVCFFKPIEDLKRASVVERKRYLDMEAREEKVMRIRGELRARSSHYMDRIPVMDKKGMPILKRDGKPKMKMIKMKKKPLKPGMPSWEQEVEFFGRKCSGWVLKWGMTLREIRLANEAQIALIPDLLPDMTECGDQLGLCK